MPPTRPPVVSNGPGNAPEALVIAMKPGIDHGLLPAIMSAFAADPAALPIEILVGGAGEQTPLVRQGRADIAFCP